MARWLKQSFKFKLFFFILLCFLLITFSALLNNNNKQGISLFQKEYDVPNKISRHDESKYIVARLRGGLGNHLWIYAGLYGIARKTDRTPVACTNYNLSEFFSNISIPMHHCGRNSQVFLAITLRIEEIKYIYYDTAMLAQLRDSGSRYAFIPHFLQNIGYFVEYLKELKSQFQVSKGYQVKSKLYLNDVLKQAAVKSGNDGNPSRQPVFVAVHVRRGDMLNSSTTKVPGPSYFRNAMDYFDIKFDGYVIFIVLTDDLSWSKLNIRGNHVYFTGDSGPMSRTEDFAVAVACNHTIMSVGTFGWWMGLLTGGEVIYYKDWIKGSSKSWYHAGQYFPYYYKPML